MNILTLDSLNIPPPIRSDPPLTHRFNTRVPAKKVLPKVRDDIEFEIHIPIASGGSQKWNYRANGYPIGQIYKFTDPGCGHDYCAKLLNSEKVARFSTLEKADRFMKDSCK